MRLEFAISLVIAYIFWIFLNLSTDPQVLVTGVPAALLASAICTRFMFRGFRFPHLSPSRLHCAFRYSVDFLIAVFRANISTARIILSPQQRLVPAVLRIPLRTTSDFVTTGVANSITLTPGTLTIDASGGFIYVHWMRATQLDPEKAKATIVGNFERYLKGVFE